MVEASPAAHCVKRVLADGTVLNSVHNTLFAVLQIIDMGLAESSPFVLGAALHWHDGHDQLLVLAPDQLVVFTITVA